ncbi:hypothetical protein [Syntrophomonas curvata]
MLENQNEIKKITSSLIKYFDSQHKWDISRLLKASYPSSEEIAYDNWNGGTYIYALIYELEIDDYLQFRPLLEIFTNEIREAAELFVRSNYEQLGEVRIVPICREYLNWSELVGIATKKDVLDKIEELKNLMIAVSTGGPQIKTVDNEYKKNYVLLDQWLETLGVDNPNPYKSLWDWYGRWSQSDLSTYASRRSFIPNLYQPLIDIITKSTEDSITTEYEPTGWDRVDRAVYEMKKRLATATTEEQFQAIGMLGRETIITVAQQVFDKLIHKTEDGVEPSETDAKRMLDAFLNYELSGASNERTRRFAKSAVDMANHLTHDRMATKRDASMCLVSVTAVASLIKLIQENASN